MEGSNAERALRLTVPWIMGGLGALIALPALALAAALTYTFHIDGQPLNQALRVFSDQSGLQIVYHTELLPEIATRRVDGIYDAQTALNRLLRGTGLVARQVNTRTFAIAAQEAQRDGDGEILPTRAVRVADQRADSPLLAQAAPNPAIPAAASASPGSAENGEGNQLTEVVVTAEKRAENIQDVPIAITAYSESDLRSKGITDIHGLSRLTPNVNLDAGSPFSGPNSVLSASIRGSGQDDFAFNLDPGVGVYLDGVYLARTIGANQNLLDVDRIEILKGPQGTLFGRNTIGGAISIVTHIPGNERRVIATASTGSFSRRDLAFTADMPINDKLLTSISVSSQVRDGYQKVIPYPTSSLAGSTPFVVDQQTSYPKAGYETSSANGGQNLKVVRGKALWHASDTVDVTLAGDWSKEDQSAYPT